MFITELSIKRPAVSWVMSLILIIFGLFVFWKLPVRELPDGIQPPVVQVQVNYKSAAASIVDQEVTQVVEDVIGGAEGIKNIDSKSENGRSTINVEFNTSNIWFICFLEITCKGITRWNSTTCCSSTSKLQIGSSIYSRSRSYTSYGGCNRWI